MKKLFKKIPLKKSFLRRSRYLFFIKNNKKNIINYGSFLKKFDFYFFFFLRFNLNFFFFKKFLNFFYLSFQKKPNYFFYKFFFFSFLKEKNLKKNFYNFQNNGQSIYLSENKLIESFSAPTLSDIFEKNKKKWMNLKFFFFGNSYFLKNINFFKNFFLESYQISFFFIFFFKKIFIFYKLFNLIFFLKILFN